VKNFLPSYLNRMQVKSRNKFINVVVDVPLDEDVGEPVTDKLNKKLEEVVGMGEALDSFSEDLTNGFTAN